MAVFSHLGYNGKDMRRENIKDMIVLSAIITVHNEGLIAHKTMRSVFEALKKVEEVGYAYEIIVHIDNGDDATLKYFDRYKEDRRIRVFKNSFGDTGSSRNFAAKESRGKYISFLDGDDLISDNWFVEAINKLESSKNEIIVHPEAILTFGIDQKNNVLSILKPSTDLNKDTITLLGENLWGSILMAKKDTFLKVPFVKSRPGYGHEDYVFSINTIYAGIEHVIAKDTILFYRRSDKSRLSTGNQNHVIIPYTKLFDFDNVRKLDYVSHEKIDEKVRSKGYRAYKKIRDNNFLNFFITPVAKMTLKILDRRRIVDEKDIPDFVVKEWVKINRIDTQLYPYPWLLNKVVLYKAEGQVAIGNDYLRLVKNIRFKPDYIFVVPWVVRGGADKVLFNYIEALKENNPSWHFAVITTLPVDNVWGGELPDYVDLIEFGKISQDLAPDQQERLFAHIITQSECKNIHIINSEYGYDWARKHVELLKNEYNLYVSLFAYEYIPESKMRAVFSYDNPELFEIMSAVKKVFTDNKKMIEYTTDTNGFSDLKFRTHYQPIKDLSLIKPKKKLLKDGKLRILWAGRVVPIKLPEVVAKIGRNVDPKKVHIDIYGEINAGLDKDMFKKIPAITYCGVYDGFSSLPTDQYDILLYTSLTDGMPNVILEATAAGLPIIASNDGGVGEFIQNGKTGILVEDYLNYRAYIEAIEGALEKPEVLEKYVKNAQKLLLERHNWNKFLEVVKKDIKD